MRSNIDIQYILDDYACAAYCVDYINKSNRGMSQLLKAWSEELFNNPNFLPKEVLKKLEVFS